LEQHSNLLLLLQAALRQKKKVSDQLQSMQDDHERLLELREAIVEYCRREQADMSRDQLETFRHEYGKYSYLGALSASSLWS
jgi:hypothetical protein